VLHVGETRDTCRLGDLDVMSYVAETGTESMMSSCVSGAKAEVCNNPEDDSGNSRFSAANELAGAEKCI
jgi:hypothetical protein